MASVRFEGVRKVYPNGHVAARGLNLAVGDGEFLVLVGPSGCGKSTALRMLAGLETPTAGRIFIADRDVTEVPPQERDVAMVFQSYALYPHMTVRDNLGFGLRMRGTPPARIAERVERMQRFAPYQINSTLLSHAPAHARVMHCLPAKRGEEITADVLDGERCIAFPQAGLLKQRLIGEKRVLEDGAQDR